MQRPRERTRRCIQKEEPTQNTLLAMEPKVPYELSAHNEHDASFALVVPGLFNLGQRNSFCRDVKVCGDDGFEDTPTTAGNMPSAL